MAPRCMEFNDSVTSDFSWNAGIVSRSYQSDVTLNIRSLQSKSGVFIYILFTDYFK
ncbi:hypothetical protein [Marinigracilibium pacificum]|uniref:hypothetical protein n=1 Tax=Marinigracilibium pacificum TaxID=2729599 RepID=UPI00146BDC60|nr:hypothetical protein [Marinigracilibium pacificum]